MSRQIPNILIAFYLACSWCWCIGMFFPVFLTEDFGWPGWVVFAIPNVIGAASVGFFMRRAGAPGRVAVFRDRNRGWIATFSVVTILFHLSFLSWFPPMPIQGVQRWMLGLAVLGLVAFFAWLPFAKAAWAAVALWVISVGCAIAATQTDGVTALITMPATDGALPHMGLVFMAPVIVFGFLLCPYLDATLLEASERATKPRVAFTLGYGVLFLTLILITLNYAGRAHEHGVWSSYTYAHIALQASFTMGVHVRALRKLGIVGARPTRRMVGLAALAVAVIAATTFIDRQGLAYAGSSGIRLSYDTFLSAYGLVFPAYMLIVAIPRARRGAVGALWLAVLLASPLMWLGAMEKQHWALSAAVGIVLLLGAVRVVGFFKGEPRKNGRAP